MPVHLVRILLSSSFDMSLNFQTPNVLCAELIVLNSLGKFPETPTAVIIFSVNVTRGMIILQLRKLATL